MKVLGNYTIFCGLANINSVCNFEEYVYSRVTSEKLLIAFKIRLYIYLFFFMHLIVLMLTISLRKFILTL